MTHLATSRTTPIVYFVIAVVSLGVSEPVTQTCQPTQTTEARFASSVAEVVMSMLLQTSAYPVVVAREFFAHTAIRVTTTSSVAFVFTMTR